MPLGGKVLKKKEKQKKKKRVVGQNYPYFDQMGIVEPPPNPLGLVRPLQNPFGGGSSHPHLATRK